MNYQISQPKSAVELSVLLLLTAFLKYSGDLYKRPGHGRMWLYSTIVRNTTCVVNFISDSFDT